MRKENLLYNMFEFPKLQESRDKWASLFSWLSYCVQNHVTGRSRRCNIDDVARFMMNHSSTSAYRLD